MASSRISVADGRSVSDGGHVAEIFTSVFSLCGCTKAPVVRWGLRIGPWRTLRGPLLFQPMNLPFLLPPGTNGASEQPVKWTEDHYYWSCVVGAECQKHPVHIGKRPPPGSRVGKNNIFLGIVSDGDTCRSLKVDTTNTENESLSGLISQYLWFYNLA